MRKRKLSPFLSDERTARLRHILANACDIFMLGVREIMAEFGDDINFKRATVARGFTSEAHERIRTRHAERYITWLARRSGINRDAIRNWVVFAQGDIPGLRAFAAAEVFPHTEAGVDRWKRYLDGLADRSKVCYLFSATPCSAFIPEQARHTLLRHQVGRGRRSRQKYRVENGYANQWRESYRERRPNERARLQSWLIFNWVGVDAWMKNVPAGGQRNEMIRSILDAHEAGVIHLALVDDRRGRKGSHLRPYFEQYDRRGVFDDQVSIRRDPSTWCRSTYLATGSSLQAKAVEEDRTGIKMAMAAAITDYPTIRDILLGFGENSQDDDDDPIDD
jgi:hypothetical protein